MAKEDVQHKFAEFLIMNDEERQKEYGYTYQKDFSAHFGVSQKTLTQWKNDRRFKRYKKELQENKWDDRLENVVQATYERAIEGDTTAQAQYFKLLGVTKDKIEMVNEKDVEYIILEVIKVLQQEIKDKSVLNNVSKRLTELAGEL